VTRDFRRCSQKHSHALRQGLMDDTDDDDDDDLEQALLQEMERKPQEAPPPVAAAPERAPQDARGTKRPRGSVKLRAHGESGDGGLGGLAFAASATTGGAGAGTTPCDGDDDDEAEDDEAAGYMWGMNILTGRTREEDEAAGLVARRKKRGGEEDLDGGRRAKARQMVQLSYGNYQGLQLGRSELRRIKAEECEAMLSRRKLVRAIPAPVLRACTQVASRMAKARLHRVRLPATIWL
jgi:hypothetical protein